MKKKKSKTIQIPGIIVLHSILLSVFVFLDFLLDSVDAMSSKEAFLLMLIALSLNASALIIKEKKERNRLFDKFIVVIVSFAISSVFSCFAYRGEEIVFWDFSLLFVICFYCLTLFSSLMLIRESW